MILDADDKEQMGVWFSLFAEIVLDDKIQYFINELIKEKKIQILNFGPERDKEEYYIHSRMLYSELELLQKQLEFFNKIKEEFEERLHQENSNENQVL